MYESVLKRFKSTLKAGPQDYRDRATFLKRQHTFVQNLVGLVKAVARENGNRYVVLLTLKEFEFHIRD